MDRRRAFVLTVAATLATVLVVGVLVDLRQRVDAPTGLHAMSIAKTRLRLTWQPVARAEAYRVRYWPSNHPADQKSARFRSPSGLLTGLTPGTKYTATVMVIDPDSGQERSSASAVLQVFTDAAPTLLRVGSFNISDPHVNDRGKDSHDWPKRRRVIAADIHAAQLDVVGIQEAYEGDDRRSLLAAVNAGGGHYDMQPPANNGRGRDNRILYDPRRIEVMRTGYERYPDQAPDDYERDLVWAVLRSKANGHPFVFATTHLTPENARQVRLQGNSLIDRVRRLAATGEPKLPVIVVGDFNTSKFQRRGSSIIENMDKAGFGDVLGQQYGTYRLEHPRAEKRIDAWIGSFNDYDRDMSQHVVSKDRIGHNIDWIFATNSLRVPLWRTVAHHSGLRVTGVFPSDHWLVTAHIVLP